MKVELWVIGNTSFPYLKEGTAIYEKRLKHYLPFEYSIIPDIKNAKNRTNEQLKSKEGAAILKKLDKGDWLVLLDEGGKEYSSLKFANYMENMLQQSHKRIIFVVGGAYGFSPEVYQRANAKISLSKMTFSHQMVRLFILEQLYRAMTILRNQPYHHE
ncbi:MULTISPECIES: 23S rRNA (pseudouridine(1915)-N(3))-methyltransferase RlmH [unclassified Aureispira]|uniref:23S rRNA (pseudouridine(1915)-N(3))-methyltransferase RlmH n=1 Tax=unclassified Aureispira TaxID=2649989 RepID=UPI000696D90F|nr:MULTISPECIES: 23S rRNA (pseudouridine(1915)-N(3))-methyltransferase RlmH [unclassified Aureispira]WMX13570.1 23S rRNA (pseudouridine(1915)-N(3))-methyltransferase RlmH [Aureispira sp. CCB-E]